MRANLARMIRVGAVVALALALAACRSAPVDPRLRLSVHGAMLSIRVENPTAHELLAPANFLDRTRRHELTLQITTERGTARAMCRDIAYADGPAVLHVAPNTANTIEVDLQSVMDAYCLESGRAHRVQAVLVGGAQPGVPFDIASNEIILTLNAPAND